MKNLELIAERIPHWGRDIKLNLTTVVKAESLSSDQRWGLVIVAAATSRESELLDAALLDAKEAGIGSHVVDDALAAASLMAMNNVFYRFRHFIEKPSYSDKPARLRMNHLVKPAGSKLDFELFSLAASAINGCETCVRAHEKVVLEGGGTEDLVHDAIRIAATVHAAATALSSARVTRT